MINALSFVDRFILAADRALRTVAVEAISARRSPAEGAPTTEPLSEPDRAKSAALMRVNHVGEVCAQAMYDAQALAARDPANREFFRRAASEEADHLAWTAGRIDALGGRRSLLNPAWYGGAFAIGWIAAKLGDRISLGFMEETERQVESHLESHLARLPAGDLPSRLVVEQMRREEAQHAATANRQGAAPLPLPARFAMRIASKIMTVTARYV